MPRKIKTAFSSSDADRAIVGIHDIGFVPVIKDGVKGFRIVVGGGTSIMPRIAPTLYEFVAADDGEYLRVTEAALRIFDRQDWLRVNRARARIKVLVDKVGMDEFRRMVDRELEGDWVAERDFSIEHLLPHLDEEGAAPEPVAAAGTPNGDRSEFEAFRADNVAPQRQEGFSTVHAKVTRGDLTPEQFRGLGQIMREFCGGNATDDDRPEPGAPVGSRRIRLRRLHPPPRTRPGRQRRRDDRRRHLLPRAPTRASSASRPRWASTGPSTSGSSRWRSPIR